MTADERETRLQLAACYRDFARRNLDDGIFTHLSARLPDQTERFLFIAFGMLFDEVTASTLLTIDRDGNNVGSSPGKANAAGWIVHKTTYDAVPEAGSVMHLHTVAGIAVSAQKEGLLPLNQFGITYHGQFAYHDYEGPGLRAEERPRFVEHLGNKRMMFLRNHGTLTHGRTITEAYTLMDHLQRACEIQIAAQAGGGDLVIPPPDVVEHTVRTAQGVGDRNFGEVGFQALLRHLDREDPAYRT